MSTYAEALRSLKPALRAIHNAPYKYRFNTERWRSGGGGISLTITVTVPHRDCLVDRAMLERNTYEHFKQLNAMPFSFSNQDGWVKIVVRDSGGHLIVPRWSPICEPNKEGK